MGSKVDREEYWPECLERIKRERLENPNRPWMVRPLDPMTEIFTPGCDDAKDLFIRHCGTIVESKLRTRTDGVWLIESKLRRIIRRFPDEPEQWTPALRRWIAGHKWPKAWQWIEIVLLDWITTNRIDREILPHVCSWYDELLEIYGDLP